MAENTKIPEPIKASEPTADFSPHNGPTAPPLALSSSDNKQLSIPDDKGGDRPEKSRPGRREIALKKSPRVRPVFLGSLLVQRPRLVVYRGAAKPPGGGLRARASIGGRGMVIDFRDLAAEEFPYVTFDGRFRALWP